VLHSGLNQLFLHKSKNLTAREAYDLRVTI